MRVGLGQSYTHLFSNNDSILHKSFTLQYYDNSIHYPSYRNDISLYIAYQAHTTMYHIQHFNLYPVKYINFTIHFIVNLQNAKNTT